MSASPDPAFPAYSEPLVGAFSGLQSLLLDSPSLDAFLTDVAKLAAAVVPSASCGITARRDGRPLTVASSDARAEEVDEVQYGADEGPCLETLRTGAAVDVPDLSTDGRWPKYQPHALDHGVRSSLSLPLAVDGSTAGALNLYGYQPAAFDGAARQQVELFAAQAAAALTLVLRTIGLVEDRANLEQALISRTVIDQAVGILMAQQRLHRRRGLRAAARPLPEPQPQAAGRVRRPDHPRHRPAAGRGPRVPPHARSGREVGGAAPPALVRTGGARRRWLLGSHRRLPRPTPARPAGAAGCRRAAPTRRSPASRRRSGRRAGPAFRCPRPRWRRRRACGWHSGWPPGASRSKAASCGIGMTPGTPEAVGPTCTDPSTSSGRGRRGAGNSAGQPAGEEGALGRVGGQLQRPLVRLPRLGGAPEPGQQVGPGGVVEVVAGQVEAVELGQPGGRPVAARRPRRPGSSATTAVGATASSWS